MPEKFFITCEHENHWTLTDATQANDKIIFLKDEYEKFWRKIVRGETFAFSRYGDGELSLMLGRKVTAQEGWTAEGSTALGKALRETLTIDAPNFFYGISCPCCDSAAYYWYLRHIKSSNVTFSNIWLNENFKTFIKNFCELERDAVLITNWRGKGKTFGRLNVKRHYFVSDDCVKFYEEECAGLIRRIIAETGHEKNLLYVVSAGPLSCVIIAELFKHNPDNCYVDFGSATDLMTHERITRPYMIDGSPYARQSCWMFDAKKISTDVDVVLSAYKRPQRLSRHLAAIKNQTLAPHRIFLYQDGINDCYKIELKNEILDEFDACKISAKNGGVWKRFEFAEEITKSPYVCIFDDDTIPGSRWLENCHVNMMQNRGVYGTNGILMADAEKYPAKALHVGWHGTNEKSCAVDFAGHSWFFEREYLPWMLAKPWREKYKFVSEDMTLSFAAFEHGFGTYVPQHPKKISSLWGSLPEFATKLGSDEAAVSKNPDNYKMMRAAVADLLAAGWITLAEKNPDYLREVKRFVAPPHRQPKLKDIAIIKNALEVLLPVLGLKPPIFLGEKKYSEDARKVFNLQVEDYHVLENERNEIETATLFDTLRQGALNIFFSDVYDELKPFLEQWGLTENVDFMDGRAFFVAYSFNFD